MFTEDDTYRVAGAIENLICKIQKTDRDKIREATLEKVPYQVVLGPRDVESGTVSLRLLSGKQVQGLAPETLLSKLREEVDKKLLTTVFQ